MGLLERAQEEEVGPKLDQRIRGGGEDLTPSPAKGNSETWHHGNQCAVAEEPRRSERLLAKKGDSVETPYMDPSPGTE